MRETTCLLASGAAVCVTLLSCGSDTQRASGDGNVDAGSAGSGGNVTRLGDSSTETGGGGGTAGNDGSLGGTGGALDASDPDADRGGTVGSGGMAGGADSGTSGGNTDGGNDSCAPITSCPAGICLAAFDDGCGGVLDCSSNCGSAQWCDNGVCAPRSGSCDGLAANCGPTDDEYCCESLLVTGGTYNRSNDASYPATVSNFKLDRFEVNVERFRNFIEAIESGWRPATGAGKHDHLNAGSGVTAAAGGFESGWDESWNAHLLATKTDWGDMVATSCGYGTWTSTPGSNETRAMNCVNWYEAYAFCIWDGGYLPTEAEWNYAAAGGSEQRVYAWSDPPYSTTIDCTYAHYGECRPNGVFILGGEHPKGDGKYGQADLTGNVSEWNLDWRVDPYPTPCEDCATLTSAAMRVIRGGSVYELPAWEYTYQRQAFAPENRDWVIGLRCARSP